MMRKKKYLSPRDRSQIEGLKKAFSLNEETNTFSVTLHYPSVEDILVNELESDCPVFKDEIMEPVNQILNNIPRGYHADFLLVIDDYGEYSPQQIINSFNRMIENGHYRYKISTEKNYRKTAVLLLSGLLLVLLLVMGRISGWWEDSSDLWESLSDYTIDVIACVIIWEGVWMAFIDHSREENYEYIISRKLSNIFLCKGTKFNILASESVADYVLANSNPRLEKVTNLFLLIASFGLMCSSLFSIVGDSVSLIEDMNSGAVNNAFPKLAMAIISFLVMLTLGVFSYKLFKEDFRYIIPTGIIGIIAFGTVVYDFIILLQSEFDYSYILEFVIFAIFIIAYILAFNKHKKWDH